MVVSLLPLHGDYTSGVVCQSRHAAAATLPWSHGIHILTCTPITHLATQPCHPPEIRYCLAR
ncbi:hypothetical protein COCVIDRAFT_86684 [Bipolaris victoriae FI3]|uniref:Uncharacterized protein n=2 Tax=Bipolaris TaxID=33194 RepID=W6YFV1_COCC2|nr:uncharacterized protein COCCADRAFT_83333 [Bipolaris zeicola 26-R-13]XP_014561347.1 hypothetical protein COCVIDRAFT_86684 [Bipolaris victoriae FI3]EUC38357.1 hypothetical protein COCCADRAFT_83333 [Bipolaris zeicola 26-R-13]